MKANVLEDIGKLEYKEVKTPEVVKGTVLVKIHACGICSSDIPRIFETGTYHFPTIPGHEFAGEIVKVSEELDTRMIGKKVAVIPLLPCYKCDPCIQGQYARCENYNYFGSRCNGGFAEYIVVPVKNLVFATDDITYKKLALCEPAAVAKHMIDTAQIKSKECVVIIGTGTIAYIAAKFAKYAGAKKVIMVGRNELKGKLAREIGIDDFVNISDGRMLDTLVRLNNGKLADVVLECVGSNAAISQALQCVISGGRIILAGNPQKDLTLEKNLYWKILRQEIQIKGIWNSIFNEEKNNWKEVIELFQREDFQDIDKLITDIYPLEKCNEALRKVRDVNQFTLKVMLEI